MSTARALANQKLYHAKILTTAWREALGQEQVAKSVLEEAFGSAVCQHLAGAYGWFLLEVTQPDNMPPAPPAGCAYLPPAAQGRETPPEIMEFARLERETWLAYILNPDSTAHRGVSQNTPAVDSHNLAAMVSEHTFGPNEAEQWHGRLSQLFDRMSDSLEEY